MNNALEGIDGLRPVKPDELEDFERAMADEVIPEILQTIEERCILAADSRKRQIKRRKNLCRTQ